MSNRLLLVADDAFEDDEAVPICVRQLSDAESVHVVAPIIASRLDTLTDDDDAHRDAQRRADRVVEALRAAGIDATGDYSTEDPYDTAITALQAGDFDGIVVATTGEGHWREKGVLERLRDSTDVPVTEIAIDDGDA